jgi:lipopolysaccharide/colanic/teichoic acid biosynthesis glycosyltransferase
MVQNADKTGARITVNKDTRITRVGRLIRRVRLDEIPQLIDVLRGTMTLVGTRPEVERYVEGYTPEMLATLLLPAGVTSEASICYKDEDNLLEGVADVDSVYLNEVLPKKMYYNLRSILEFGFWRDIKIIIRTVFAVLIFLLLYCSFSLFVLYFLQIFKWRSTLCYISILKILVHLVMV